MHQHGIVKHCRHEAVLSVFRGFGVSSSIETTLCINSRCRSWFQSPNWISSFAHIISSTHTTAFRWCFSSRCHSSAVPRSLSLFGRTWCRLFGRLFYSYSGQLHITAWLPSSPLCRRSATWWTAISLEGLVLVMMFLHIFHLCTAHSLPFYKPSSQRSSLRSPKSGRGKAPSHHPTNMKMNPIK